MKKLIPLIFLLILSLGVKASDTIKPLDKKTIRSMTAEERQARVNVLENRLNDIQYLDLKTMNRAGRRDIKREVKDIQRELRTQALEGGIYISAGALIIIILLLIILL